MLNTIGHVSRNKLLKNKKQEDGGKTSQVLQY